MKTYLILWHSSEGVEPSNVVQKLTSIGFKHIKGQYDLEYDHERNVDVEEIMELGRKVHQTLKGTGVLYKMETP